MNIIINGQKQEVSESLLALIAESFGAVQPFALAVNGQFVPKSQHQNHVVNPGDVIDILSPVQGG